MESEPLYSVTEIANRLKIKPATLRLYVRSGKLNALRIGERGNFRITESEYRRFAGV